MKKNIFVLLMISTTVLLSGEIIYQNGILINPVPYQNTFNAEVVDSFRSPATGYSMGLPWDGKYLWNDEAFTRWFAKVDTLGNMINSYTPTSGNRDMTFDGRYLWATDWQAAQVFKYDTSNCSIIAAFTPPFGGKPNGMTWDGKYLWVGEENGRIYQCDTCLNLIRSIPAPNNTGYNPRGLAFDGKDLYVGCQTIGIIYRIDTIDGTIQEQFSSPSRSLQQGLTWDGKYLWSTGGNNWVYKIKPTVNIEEREKELFQLKTGVNFEIYPNPARRTVNFRITAHCARKVSLAVYNSTGSLIKQFTCEAIEPTSKLNFDLKTTQFKPGIYFIRLQSGPAQVTRKLVYLK
ncbi:MAG: T9SS type A sorting domain-containing protein [candidate division WOR-3 bacterium]